MTPLVQGNDAKGEYPLAIVAHTLGSIFSGALYGAMLALPLAVVGLHVHGEAFAVAVALMSTVLALREMRLLAFPVPNIVRQADPRWLPRHGLVAAGWLWGMDLGSGLRNLVTFSGYWLLVAAIAISADPSWGAVLLATYALGRSVAVWLPPLISGTGVRTLLAELHELRTDAHAWHGATMAALTIGIVAHEIARAL